MEAKKREDFKIHAETSSGQEVKCDVHKHNVKGTRRTVSQHRTAVIICYILRTYEASSHGLVQS